MAHRRVARRKQEKVELLVREMSAPGERSAAGFRVTLTGSEIGGTDRQRSTLRCLGLRKRGSSAVVKDTPQARGRIRAVAHLVKVEEA
jgi:large subunit ribosomal protein L30